MIDVCCYLFAIDAAIRVAGAQEAVANREEQDAKRRAEGAFIRSLSWKPWWSLWSLLNVIVFECCATQHEINLRSQELTENKKKEKIKSALTKRKRDEREAVASGKNPFYLKVRVLLCAVVCCSFTCLYAVLNACEFTSRSAKTRRSWSSRPSSRTCRRAASCPSSWRRSERKTPARTTVGCQRSARPKVAWVVRRDPQQKMVGTPLALCSAASRIPLAHWSSCVHIINRIDISH